MKRVMVFGAPGSGKSTLAKKVGELAGLPVVHIDPIYWKPGWTERDRDEVLSIIRSEIAKDQWVFDGNHTSSFAERVERVDTMIYLDFGTLRRLWRVVLRTLKSYGKTRPDMGIDCPERFDWGFLVFTATYKSRGSRDKALTTLRSAPDYIEKHHLKGQHDVDRFLEQLSNRVRQLP